MRRYETKPPTLGEWLVVAFVVVAFSIALSAAVVGSVDELVEIIARR